MTIELEEIRESARQISNDLGVAASEEKTWPLVLELGLLQVAVPEALGGLGQGLAGACAIYRELGASVVATPHIAAMLAIDALSQSELSDRETWIERLTSSDYAAAPLAECSVIQDGERFSGLACAVPSADLASHVLVYTRDAQCVALVPRSAAGVELQARPTWDVTRRLFDVRLNGAQLAPSSIVARGAAAQQLVQRLHTHRDFALAADSLGGANALLEMTVEYLKSRRQFGRPLALFQALKHRCADLKVMVAAADALLTDSLTRIDRVRADEAEALGLNVKYLACAAYARVGEEGLQLHGGIGMTSDHSLHLFLKRALLNEHLGRRSESYELDIAAGLLD